MIMIYPVDSVIQPLNNQGMDSRSNSLGSTPRATRLEQIQIVHVLVTAVVASAKVLMNAIHQCIL